MSEQNARGSANFPEIPAHSYNCAWVVKDRCNCGVAVCEFILKALVANNELLKNSKPTRERILPKTIDERLLQVIQDDIVQGDDGYYIYWPESNRGAFTPKALRIIAAELDRRNSEWEAELKRIFGET